MRVKIVCQDVYTVTKVTSSNWFHLILCHIYVSSLKSYIFPTTAILYMYVHTFSYCRCSTSLLLCGEIMQSRIITKRIFLLSGKKQNFLISSHTILSVSSHHHAVNLVLHCMWGPSWFSYALCNCLVMCQHQLIKTDSWCTARGWHADAILMGATENRLRFHSKSQSKLLPVLEDGDANFWRLPWKPQNERWQTTKRGECVFTGESRGRIVLQRLQTSLRF